ncbi:MAG: type II toxin-antitoxin system VapC family toxin [Steroidobacteraceae bacterium]|nr:type II toxin-antitoxin system VapC family toxin [Steroidobacteraceae bacterium]
MIVAQVSGALDTNLLVRLLVDDDQTQALAVQELIRRNASTGNSLFVPVTVVLELEWVLRSRYGYSRETLLSAFSALLETRELEFQDEATIEEALNLYRRGHNDFADCLHLGSSATRGKLPFLTFDRAAARLPGAEMLLNAHAHL